MGIQDPDNIASLVKPAHKLQAPLLAATPKLDGGRIGISLSRR